MVCTREAYLALAAAGRSPIGGLGVCLLGWRVEGGLSSAGWPGLSSSLAGNGHAIPRVGPLSIHAASQGLEG